MSQSLRTLGAASLLSLLAVFGLAGTAGAETPSCGAACISVASYPFAMTPFPSVLVVANGGLAQIGEPVALAAPSTSNSAEDFTAEDVGTVEELIDAGLVSPSFSPYDSDLGFEFEYAPDGRPTALCVGIASASSPADSMVTLQYCGVSARTVWIRVPEINASTVELLNGSSTSAVSPDALTTLLPGFPLLTVPLKGTLPTQLWVLPAPPP